jgi:hypothetical protein
MKIKGNLENIEIEVTQRELAYSIMGIVNDRLHGVDDAGCDWYTWENSTFIANDWDWKVSDNPEIAALVNAANILAYGRIFEMTAV